MSELTYTLPPGELVLKESADNHFLRPQASLIGRLCHPTLTTSRLVFCEAYYDVFKKREKGVGSVIYEIPLASIESLDAGSEAVEPCLEIYARNVRRELEKIIVFFRDEGWSSGAPERFGERDAWLAAIHREREKSGQPLRAAPPSRPAAAKESGDSKKILAGKFELLRQIGAGGMGLVFEGKDHTLDRSVAVKKMRPDVKLTGRDKSLFMKEAKLSASLHHPFIVDIYAILEEDDEIFLVFEYVDGKTLQEILDEKGRLSAGEFRPALKCVCEALAYAHASKVAHRDVKPSNIMLSKQGYAKVMDFGIARQIKDTASRLSTTKTGPDTSGTMPYMAPEQELGKSNACSDIFSLGATVYEALTGELPYGGPNFYQQKKELAFAPILTFAPDVPPEFARAVERALSFEAKDRFQSIEEFAKAMGAA